MISAEHCLLRRYYEGILIYEGMEYEWNTHTYICTYEGIFYIPSFVYTYLYTFVPSKVFICYPAEGIYLRTYYLRCIYMYVFDLHSYLRSKVLYEGIDRLRRE